MQMFVTKAEVKAEAENVRGLNLAAVNVSVVLVSRQPL
jgi:hypothetical protein